VPTVGFQAERMVEARRGRKSTAQVRFRETSFQIRFRARRRPLPSSYSGIPSFLRGRPPVFRCFSGATRVGRRPASAMSGRGRSCQERLAARRLNRPCRPAGQVNRDEPFAAMTWGCSDSMAERGRRFTGARPKEETTRGPLANSRNFETSGRRFPNGRGGFEHSTEEDRFDFAEARRGRVRERGSCRETEMNGKKSPATRHY